MLVAYSRPSISPPDTSSETDNILVTIPGSSSGDVDSILLTDLCSVKYNLCVFNLAEDKFKSFELFGNRIGGSDVEDTLYGIIGDVLNFTVEFLVVGSDVILRIVNSETFALTIEGVKIK